MKRIFDIIASLFLIMVISPLFIILFILVLFIMGLPLLFSQTRPGLNGQLFTFYKLRTMTQETDTEVALLPDKDRLTKFGVFLRKYSLDELPSLWNVLKGDMSFVGPRPLLMEYLDRYSPEQARRHEVKPGITGWAQVNGRNAISWEEKFNLDVWYVDNQSFWLDMKIIAMTLWKLITMEGINSPGEATMSLFTGVNLKEK